jgi:hypothetical protein
MKIWLWIDKKKQGLWNGLIFNFNFFGIIISRPKIQWESFRLASVCWLLKKTETTATIVNTKPKNWTEQLVTFVSIWPMHQWIFSLITLILMYWVIGRWYNKKLKRQGGWISWQTRVVMIFIDLIINLVLGIYYMGSRDTIMGEIMLRCPIAISPLIFLIEFLVFIWYYKKYVLNKEQKSSKEKNSS